MASPIHRVADFKVNMGFNGLSFLAYKKKTILRRHKTTLDSSYTMDKYLPMTNLITHSMKMSNFGFLKMDLNTTHTHTHTQWVLNPRPRRVALTRWGDVMWIIYIRRQKKKKKSTKTKIPRYFRQQKPTQKHVTPRLNNIINISNHPKTKSVKQQKSKL